MAALQRPRVLRPWICRTCRAQCHMPVKYARRSFASYAARAGSPRRETTNVQSPPGPSPPRDDFYALLLEYPLPVSNTSPAQNAKKSTREEKSTSSSNSDLSNPIRSTRAFATNTTSATTPPSIIFSSRLNAPRAEDRQKEQATQRARGQGTMIAGTWIPPRPAEPDNCCMSGCVNCVWDTYREELESWAATRQAALARAQQSSQSPSSQSPSGQNQSRQSNQTSQFILRTRSTSPSRPSLKDETTGQVQKDTDSLDDTAASMDEDGARWTLDSNNSISNSDSDSDSTDVKAQHGDDDLFAGVPVGIREFMRTEKRLRAQHQNNS